MNLPSELVSSFVKATKDTTRVSNESTVYGVVVEKDGKLCVRIDGAESDQYTPISTTANVTKDDRVVVMIKDHSATIIGNISQPSATTNDVGNIGTQLGSQIDRLELLIADKLDSEDLLEQVQKMDAILIENAEIKTTLSEQEVKMDSLESTFSTEINKLKNKDVEIEAALSEHEARITNLESSSIPSIPEDLEDRIVQIETNLSQVDNKFSDYSTTEQIQSIIAQSENSILSSVSNTYTTKEELAEQEARIDKLESTPSVPEDLEDRITQIETTISEHETRIDSLESTPNPSIPEDLENRIIGIESKLTQVENKFSDYSTTEQMESAIVQYVQTGLDDFINSLALALEQS